MNPGSNTQKLVDVTTAKLQSASRTAAKNYVKHRQEVTTNSFASGADIFADLIGQFLAVYIPAQMSIATPIASGKQSPTGIWTGTLAMSFIGMGQSKKFNTDSVNMISTLSLLDLPRQEQSGLIDDMKDTDYSTSTLDYASSALSRFPDIAERMKEGTALAKDTLYDMALDKRGRVVYFKAINSLLKLTMAYQNLLNQKIVESAMSRLARKEKV